MAEVVIHDVNKNRIAYINGTLSKRKVGDESLLDTKELDDIHKVIYPKLNFDGRLVKSISVLLENKYLLCINYDVSIFNKMQNLSSTFLKVSEQPASLFTNDWQEKLHASINNYLQSHNLSLNYLSLLQKKALVKYLFELGAFDHKKATDYVAKTLSLGRATVFKYLKEWKNK